MESFFSRSLSVSLLGGNVRAFFRDGAFHEEHEESKRGREHPEGEEGSK
jgi:hypothetical protein